MISYKYTIYGRVQGVGFRYFVHSLSVELGFCGEVKNLSDGSVEAIIEAEESLHRVIEKKLNKGNFFSRVEGVIKNEVPLKNYKEFKISY